MHSMAQYKLTDENGAESDSSTGIAAAIALDNTNRHQGGQNEE